MTAQHSDRATGTRRPNLGFFQWRYFDESLFRCYRAQMFVAVFLSSTSSSFSVPFQNHNFRILFKSKRFSKFFWVFLFLSFSHDSNLALPLSGQRVYISIFLRRSAPSLSCFLVSASQDMDRCLAVFSSVQFSASQIKWKMHGSGQRRAQRKRRERGSKSEGLERAG